MDEVKLIPINQIIPSKTNPRTWFDEGKLNELARSIKVSGVVQPLLIRPLKKRYELIAGERRLRASQRAGLVEVPCVIRRLSDRETLEVQIVENAQREDVNPMDDARALLRLRETLDYDVSEICERVGKSDAYVYNMLSLCKMPEAVQKLVYDGALSKGVAWEIARLKTAEQQQQAAFALSIPEWSERATTIKAAKSYIASHFGDKAQSRKRKPSDAQARGANYVANWKHYLVRFEASQFLRWKQIVNGRVDTTVLAEAVEAVMLELEHKVAAVGT
ncbi:MAG TPA: ParB/RepB/Spo0J family partition protein [Pyrinomonadaceae bacterium]|nr:ParB/RepB/Spo0J family partition protein [Pyrinomonadaceae bacterium]